MEKNEVITLEDRGFIQVIGVEAKDFLQNIVTNDLEKVSSNSTVFSSILTPQGKYLFEFFILKLKDGYLLESEKKSATEIIKLLNFYKLRSKVEFIDLTNNYMAAVISLEKFKEINNSSLQKGSTVTYLNDLVYVDPRNVKLGAKIISKLENIQTIIKKLNLKNVDKNKYYSKSFELGIPQIDLDKLKEKIFGIENNLDELNGIDFKKGCYIGQENTSRIKLRNKLRRRILPVHKITGEVYENAIIKIQPEITKNQTISSGFYDQLINYAYTKESLSELYKRYKNPDDVDIQYVQSDAPLWDRDIIRKDGSRVYNKKYAERSQEDLATEVDGWIEYSMSSYSYSQKLLKTFSALLDHYNKNYEVILLLSPYHPLAYKKILEKKRIIVEVENRIRSIASASNIQVIGSYNPSKNKCTVEEFYDGAHPKDICMRRVMNELNGIDSK